MSILDRDSDRVHSNPWEDFETPSVTPLAFEGDEAWFASTLGEEDHAIGADPGTDLAWLDEQAGMLGRPAAGTDPTGAWSLGCAAAGDLAYLLKHAKAASAGAWLDDPNTPYTRARVEAVRFPSGPFGSRLAEALADLGGSYLDDGRLVAKLLGYEILGYLKLAEKFGSADATELVIDEAAWKAAMEDEVYLIGGGDWN